MEGDHIASRQVGSLQPAIFTPVLRCGDHAKLQLLQRLRLSGRAVRRIRSDWIEGRHQYVRIRCKQQSHARRPTGLAPPPLGQPVPGINTIVCNGTGSIVTQLQTLTGIENKCIGDCMLIHELVHVDQVFNQGNATICKGQPKGMQVPVIGTESQVEGPPYQAEHACLLKRLQNQPCGPCTATINSRMNTISRFMQ